MSDSEVIATSELKQRIAETDFLVPYVNDKDKEPIWDGSVPMHGYDLHDPMSYLLDDNDIYLYVRHMVSGEFFAIEHIANIEAGSHEVNVKISANGKEYYNKAIFERRRSGDNYIKFGKSFEIKFCKNKEDVKFNYTLTGNLDERIIALSFLVDMSSDNGFSIDGSLCEGVSTFFCLWKKFKF